jgi:hypothetical protein
LIHTEVLEDDTEDNHQESPDQESGTGLGHTPKLADRDHIIGKTVEMLGEVTEDIVQGGPDQESFSRELGHAVMLAAEDHTVGQIVKKTRLSGNISMECKGCRYSDTGYKRGRLKRGLETHLLECAAIIGKEKHKFNIMEKTTELLEDAVEHMIADGVDAATDWEAELEEFADMFDGPDDGPDAL